MFQPWDESRLVLFLVKHYFYFLVTTSHLLNSPLFINIIIHVVNI